MRDNRNIDDKINDLKKTVYFMGVVFILLVITILIFN